MTIQSLTKLSVVCGLSFFFASGCLPEITAPKIAEPLLQDQTQTRIPKSIGFGSLPVIKSKNGKADISILTDFPKLPTEITIIRVKQGVPNDTELKNIASSIGIPGGVLSGKQDERDMSLNWKDETGLRWIYNAAQRTLLFMSTATTGTQNTLQTLPSNDYIMEIANTFLQNRGVKLSTYRMGLPEPDWNQWWLNIKATGRCMDESTITAIRNIAYSTYPLYQKLPPMPSTAEQSCTTPEFPSKIPIIYRMVMDGRDVLDSDGDYVNGAELLIDIGKRQVTTGRIVIHENPDRSEYPAVSSDIVMAALSNGGLTGESGKIEITSFDYAFLRVPDTSMQPPQTYLILTLIANGNKILDDDTKQAVRLMVPLISNN